jgi:hypothetical protein
LRQRENPTESKLEQCNELAPSFDHLVGAVVTVTAAKGTLRRQTECAIQVRVFGVPSFVVDGEIFWGNDRLQLLNEYLQGRLPADKAKVEEILSRPRAAERSRK